MEFFKTVLFYLFIFSFTEVNAQKTALENLQTNDSTIYFFSRGSKAKSAMIAEKFNLQDKNITHVGIGYFEGQSAVIFNITDSNPIGNSAFQVDDINSFLNGNVFYFSIWACKNSASDLDKLKKICAEYSNTKVSFDFDFKLSTDNQLYCSEFCARIINQINPNQALPSEITLEEFHQVFLDRKTLVYFPVDFFENQSHKIFEQWISEK